MIWFLGVLVLGVIWYVLEARRRKSHPVTGGLHNETTLDHSAAVEVYSNSFSHCSRKVRLVMAELNIEHKHHHIDLIETGWYQTISPAYLKVNPSGLVPTLVHNGHPVFESDDILKYATTLADACAVDLEPEHLQTEIQKWLDFCTISSDNPMGGMKDHAGACIPGLTLPLFVTSIRYIPLHRILVGFLFHADRKRPLFFTAAKLLGLERTLSLKPVRQMLPPARRHMATHLRTLDEALARADGDWLLGAQFTLADITVAALLLRLDETGWLDHFSANNQLEGVAAYYARLKQRPSWQTAISDKRHPIIDRAAADLREQATQPAIHTLLYAGD